MSLSRADPALRRGRLVGQALCPGNYNDFHLNDHGDHRFGDRGKTGQGEGYYYVERCKFSEKLNVEPHGQARGTTWFRRFASRTARCSGTTSRSVQSALCIHPRLKPWPSASGVKNTRALEMKDMWVTLHLSSFPATQSNRNQTLAEKYGFA